MAGEYKNILAFTQLDAIMNADLANRMGANDLPMVLILYGTEMRKKIDYDNIELSIRGAIDEWKEAATRTPEADVADMDDEYEDEYDEDYDEEYDGEDLDEDFEAEEAGDAEE